MGLEVVSASKCFGGVQYVYSHPSETTNCTMRFSAFGPPQAETAVSASSQAIATGERVTRRG